MTEPAVDEVGKDKQDAQKLDEEHIAEVTKKRRRRPRKCKEITQENVITENAATSKDQAGIGREKGRNSDSQDVTPGDGNQTLLESTTKSAKNHQVIEQGHGATKKRGWPQKQSTGDGNQLLPEVTASSARNHQNTEQSLGESKKRGRPQKQYVTSGEGNQSLPAVALGSTVNLQNTEQGLGVTTKRGRPRTQDRTSGDGNLSHPEVSVDSAKNQQVIEEGVGVIKKRGRPRKQGVTSGDGNQPFPEVSLGNNTNLQDNEQGLRVTKKKGRPRKQNHDVTSVDGNQLLPEVAPGNTINHQKIHQDLGVTKKEDGNQLLPEVAPGNTINHQKIHQDLGVTKKRGRPRKQDVTSGEGNQSFPAVALGSTVNLQNTEHGLGVATKRGRPRTQDRTSGDGNLSHPEVSADSSKNRQVLEEGVRVTKKRGRPRKQGVTSGDCNQPFPEISLGSNKNLQDNEQGLRVTTKRGRLQMQDRTSGDGNQSHPEVSADSAKSHQVIEEDVGVTKKKGRPRKQDVTSGISNQLLPEVTAGTKTNQKVEQGCKVTKKRGRPQKRKQIMETAHDMKICPDKDETRTGSQGGSETFSQNEVTNSRGKHLPEVAGSGEKLEQGFKVNKKRGRPRKHKQSTKKTSGDGIMYPDADGSTTDGYKEGSETIRQPHEDSNLRGQGINKEYSMLDCSAVADKIIFQESTPEGLIDVSTTSPPLMSPMATPALSTTDDTHLSVKTSRTDAEKGTNGRKHRQTSIDQKSMEAAELQVAQKRRKMDPRCICQYCKKSFSSVTNCLRHENLHTGHKPYKCDLCIETFSNATYLKRHIDKVHGSVSVQKETKLCKDTKKTSQSGPISLKPVVAIEEDDTCTTDGLSSDHFSKQKHTSFEVIAADDKIPSADTTEKPSHPQTSIMVKGNDNSICLQESDLSLKVQKSRRGRPRKLKKKASSSIGGTSSVSLQSVESSMASESVLTTGADDRVTRSKEQNHSSAKTTALAQKKLVAENQQVKSSIASVSSSTSGADDRGTRSKEGKRSSVEAFALAQKKLLVAEKQEGDVRETRSETQNLSSVNASASAQKLQVAEKQNIFGHTHTRLRVRTLQCAPRDLNNEADVQKPTTTTTSSIGPTLKPLENYSNEDGINQMVVPMVTKKVQKLKRSTSSRHTCQFCKKVFYSSWNCNRHERLHTGMKPYKCMQCTEAFSNGSYLKQHVKRIHEKYSVKKQVEKLNGKSQKDQETGAKYVKAVEQRATTDVISNATATNVGPSLKTLEDNNRKDNNQVADTKKGKKPKKSTSSSRTCQYCEKVFYSSYTRIRHERLHTGIKPFKCLQCAEAFSNTEYLKWHVKRFHEACSVKKQKVKQSGKPEKDQESGAKQCNALKNLNGVDASKGGNQRCICQFCKKVFSNFAVHRRHERLHTGQKLYKCKWCAEAFANGIFLPHHVGEVHTGADEKSQEPKQMTKIDGPAMKPLENSNKDDTKHIIVSMDTKKQKKLKRDTSSSRTCQYCKKVFYSSWSRIRHERLHTGIKPYKCMQCAEAFLNGEHLQLHMKRFHEACSVRKQVKKQNGKPQRDKETGKGRGNALKNLNGLNAGIGSNQSCICQFCKKVFSKVGNCRRHERLHTGQKPYKCKMCAEAFANGTYLQLHVGKVHNGAAENLSKEGKQIKKTQKKDKKRVRFDMVSGQKATGKDLKQEKKSTTINRDVKQKCNSKHSENTSKQKRHKNQDTKDVQPQVGSKKSVSKQKQHKNQDTKGDKTQIESKGNVSNQKHHQRPGVCHFCKKVFTRVEYCMEHENSFHMGLKPYKCLLCGAAFGLSSSLYKHKKKCVGDGTTWTVSGMKDTRLSWKKVSDVYKTSSTLRKVGEEKTPLGLSQQTYQNFQQKNSSTYGRKNKTNKGMVLPATSRKQDQDKILQRKSQLKIKEEHCNGMSSLPKVNQNGEPSSHQNDLTAQHPIVSSVYPTKDAKRSTKIVKKCLNRKTLQPKGGKQITASKTISPVAKSSQAKRKSCSYCGKVFSRNRVLIHEKAVHLRLKLYPCPWCDKKYSWPHDLNKHKKTHEELNTNPAMKQEKENNNERREKGQIQPKVIDSGVLARSGTDREITTTDMPSRRVKEAGKAHTQNSSSSGHGALTRLVQTQSQSSPALSANGDNMLSCVGQVQKPEQASSAQYESSCESHVDDNFDVENWFENENNNADDVSQTTEEDTFQIINISNYTPVCHKEINESATGVVGNRNVPVLRSNTTKSHPATLISNLENDDSNVNKDKVASATPARVSEKGLCDVASLGGTESIAVEKGSVPKHNHTHSSERIAEIRDQDCSGINYVVQTQLSQKYSVVIMSHPSAETKTLVDKGEDKQDKGSNTMTQNSELATFTSDESSEKMQSLTGEKSVAVQSEEDRDIVMLETEKRPSTPLKPPWTCKVCGLVFDSRITFVYHQRIHDGDGVMNGRAALWTMPEGVYSEQGTTSKLNRQLTSGCGWLSWIPLVRTKDSTAQNHRSITS